MRKHLRLALAGVCALIAGPLALPSSAAPAPADAGPTPVITGLAGPLHLSYHDATDKLYVADAFAGLVWKTDPATGAKAPAPGGVFEGRSVNGVDMARNGGGYYVALANQRTGAASLVKVSAQGQRRTLADLLQFEKDHNPDGQPQGEGDALANPYDVLAVNGGAYVADAAGNDVVFVPDRGKPRLVTALPVSRRGACADVVNNGVPDGGCDAVPTDMFMTDDGMLYVSGLGSEVEGFVWKINPGTGKIVRTWRNLPPLTGVAVDRAGNVYGASLFAGSIVRITPGGARSSVAVPGPAGLALNDGWLYAGTLDFGGGPGSVVRLGTWAFDK